jgi:hypothetical protein
VIPAIACHDIRRGARPSRGRAQARVLGFAPGQDLYAQIKAVSLIAASERPAVSRTSADVG